MRQLFSDIRQQAAQEYNSWESENTLGQAHDYPDFSGWETPSHQGMEDRTQVGLRGLPETGNPPNVWVADMAGVGGAGLFVGKERWGEGAPKIFGGVSFSHWSNDKLSMRREKQNLTINNAWEALTLSEPQQSLRHKGFKEQE